MICIATISNDLLDIYINRCLGSNVVLY